MNKNRLKIRRMTIAAFFAAIEVVLAVTPLGYLYIGPIALTTLHLPVILAGVLFGPGMGTFCGFVFGLTSFLRATFEPTITSFVVTPFVTIGGIHGNFWSFVVAFAPRILLGYLSGVSDQFLKKQLPSYVADMICAGFNTILHTVLFLGLVVLFFGEQYALALNVPYNTLVAVIVGATGVNAIFEMLVAILVIPLLAKGLRPVVERDGLKNV